MSKTLTIVFRGLLVFHKRKSSSLMEIGILPEPTEHVPRIMTIRNGVLESTTLLSKIIKSEPGVWQLRVDQPKQDVTLRQSGPAGETVDRIHPPIPHPPTPDDFRLILNLANKEFPYGQITGKPPSPQTGKTQLDFSKLKVVVQVPNGDFYTRLPSQPLDRQDDPPNGQITSFGIIAGVVGCDILLDDTSTGAALFGPVAGAPPIFPFKPDENVIYEFSNSPADIAEHPGPGMSHFMHYYDLFVDQSVEKFDFQNSSGGPGPNPALCGSAYIGETDEPLQ